MLDLKTKKSSVGFENNFGITEQKNVIWRPAVSIEVGTKEKVLASLGVAFTERNSQMIISRVLKKKKVTRLGRNSPTQQSGVLFSGVNKKSGYFSLL